MVKILLGDSAKKMKELSDNSVDLILTDPPYNIGNFMKKRQANIGKMRANFFVDAGWDNEEYNAWISHMSTFLAESKRVLKKGGSMIMFMSILKVESIVSLASGLGFYYKTTGVWHKTNPMPRNMNLHFVALDLFCQWQENWNI